MVPFCLLRDQSFFRFHSKIYRKLETIYDSGGDIVGGLCVLVSERHPVTNQWQWVRRQEIKTIWPFTKVTEMAERPQPQSNLETLKGA